MYDVAVIGAGFAGVTAARDLSLEGYSVVQLEARDRIGGRTFLGEAFGSSVDFGGTYVHWTQPHVWPELERYGIGVVTPMEIERAYWLADGIVHSGTPAEHADVAGPLVARCLADARARFPRPFDISAADTSAIEKETLGDRLDSLNLSRHERDVLGGVLASLVHSEGEQGIAQFLFWSAIYFGSWSAFLEAAGHLPIEGGTKRLLDAIMGESKAELWLSTPVAAVEDDGLAVMVTTREGERIRARRAVVALPLNTLSDVTITPEVARPVRTLIERKQPMRTRKIWARVKGEIEPFTASAPAGKHPINTARTEYRHEGDTLVVCFCSDASAIDGEDREAVQRALRLFVPGVEVVDTACHDWAADPFSQGTWVHHRPGMLTGAAPLMREPHGRIHFAGGDIAAVGVGGIDGAIETGAKAARDIVRALAAGRD
ncbi:FAD-dependent oxidoreductase [Streptomyces antnestii]|uniref:FAD-dependent oxidoreductase n=1 Tax=Streptomyces antnestii TaxID=2494256 RepID=A0A3S2XUF4_9ACTN|nr:NAD(P)/FAD-dependent oxidoreductase [Streptomyces sp. San01]RVU23272.1 FAD-dependent oxidoreductase [Streptomyces sp. San01]